MHELNKNLSTVEYAAISHALLGECMEKGLSFKEIETVIDIAKKEIHDLAKKNYMPKEIFSKFTINQIRLSQGMECIDEPFADRLYDVDLVE